MPNSAAPCLSAKGLCRLQRGAPALWAAAAAFIEPRAAGMPLPVREAPSPLFYVLHLFADLFDLVFEGEGGAGDL